MKQILLFIIAGLLVLLPAVFAADFTCDSCRACSNFLQNGSMTNGDTLFVTADLQNDTNHCIDFGTRDNVILDCQDHQLDGTWFFIDDHAGIEMSSTSGNTVRNCDITTFYAGINNDYSSSNRFENVTITDSGTGFRMAAGSNNVLIDMDISDNHYEDIVFGNDCSNSIINTVTTGGSQVGFVSTSATLENQNYASLYLCDADDTVLRNVVVENGMGLQVINSDRVLLEDVTVQHTDEFMIMDSDDVTINGLTALDNGLVSLRLFSVNGLDGTDLTIGTSDETGIQIGVSSDIALSSSSITGNDYGVMLQEANVSVYQVTVDNTIANYSVDNESVLNVWECIVDAECNNGLYCDGAETCANNVCVSNPLTMDDGISCTIDSCDEGTDSIMHTANNSVCDNGLFCDGAETCDAMSGCVAGTAVDCDDSNPYTIDACNDVQDQCTYTDTECINDSECNDGLYCNGVETCSAGMCVSGSAITCNDGNSGTSDSCSETADACIYTPIDTNDGSSSSSSSSSSSRSSGGSSGSASVSRDDFTEYIRDGNYGETVAISIENSDLPIVGLDLQLQDDIGYSKLTVNRMLDKPRDVPTLTNVVNYLEISLSNNAESDVDVADIEFRLERQFDKYTVTMYHYNSGRWIALDTEKLYSDGTYTYYRAATPSFSYFAIAYEVHAKPATDNALTGNAVKDTASETVNETQSNQDNETKEAAVLGKSPSAILFFTLVLLVSLLVALILGVVITKINNRNQY